MDVDQHGDPVADAAARAAQLAATVVAVAEAVARLRATRLADRAAEDERRAAALRAAVHTDAVARSLERLANSPEQAVKAGHAPSSEPGTSPVWRAQTARSEADDVLSREAMAEHRPSPATGPSPPRDRVETYLLGLHHRALSAYREAIVGGADQLEAAYIGLAAARDHAGIDLGAATARWNRQSLARDASEPPAPGASPRARAQPPVLPAAPTPPKPGPARPPSP